MSESACVQGSNHRPPQEVVADGDKCTTGGHDPGLASGVRYRNSFGTHRDVLNSLEADLFLKVALVLLGALAFLCLLGGALYSGTPHLPN